MKNVTLRIASGRIGAVQCPMGSFYHPILPQLTRRTTARSSMMSLAIKMISLMWPLLAFLTPRAFVLAIPPLNASQGPEALATRSYFYVGGEYVDVICPFTSNRCLCWLTD